MFLPWFLLAQFISLVGGDALTTQGGFQLPATDGAADFNTTREPSTTERAILLSLPEGTDQTPVAGASTDQHNSSDYLSTGEPTSPASTEVTSGKTQPTTFEAISITAEGQEVTSVKTEHTTFEAIYSTAEGQGLTRYRSAEPPAAGRASEDDGIEWKKQENVFSYDYQTLRIQGLILAAIFFVTGILVLTCGSCTCASCCRNRKKRRAYNEETRL